MACDPFLAPWQAAIIAVLVSVAMALVVERVVIRPLQHADALIKSLATAAVLALSSGVVLQIFGLSARNLPQDKALVPAGGFTLFGVVVEWERLLMFVASLALVAGLGWLLRRSWLGLGVRAAGQLPDVAQLMGVRPVAVARFNWALGGALAALAGVLYAPLTDINAGTFTFMLVKTVGAALIGGLVSLPLTFAGGIALGLVESLLPHFWARPGSADVGIAVLVFLLLVVNSKRLALYSVHSGGGSARAVPGRARVVVAEWISGVSEVCGRVPRPVRVLVALGLAAIPLVNEFYAAVGLNVVYYALAALSFVLITGSCGQPSLIQMGFVGIGAYTITTATYHGASFGMSLALAVALCFVVGLGMGLVTLRFRGVEFAILTLTLAAVVSNCVLTDINLNPLLSHPTLLGLDLLIPQYAYLVMLGMAALAFLVVRNVQRSAWGRALVSLRQGKRILAHSGTSPTRMEAVAFALSCAVAGLAGGAYALLVGQFGTAQFAPLYSITLLLAALVGGLRSLWGPVITGVIFGIAPTLLQKLSFSTDVSNAFPQIMSSLAVLVLLIVAPQGLASLGTWARRVRERAPVVPMFRGRPVPVEGLGLVGRALPGPRNGHRPRRPAPTELVGKRLLRRPQAGIVGRRLSRTGAVGHNGALVSANGAGRVRMDGGVPHAQKEGSR